MSERYDYHEAVKNDILEWLDENGEQYADEDGTISDRSRDKIYDELFISDSVTGNGSGSYTFNTWTAEENLCHNLDLCNEAYAEFGGEMHEDAESRDVTIRCYLLGQLLSECIDEYNEAHEKEEENAD